MAATVTFKNEDEWHEYMKEHELGIVMLEFENGSCFEFFNRGNMVELKITEPPIEFD